MKKVLIIATVGPASDNETTLKALVLSGANIVRINGSHAQPEYISNIKKLVDKINAQTGSAAEVMLDLPGPKIRIGGDDDYRLEIKTSKTYTIGVGCDIPLKYDYAQSINYNDVVRLSDGKIELLAVSRKNDVVCAKALNAGTLTAKQSIYAPAIKYKGKYPTVRDLALIKFGRKAGIKLFALSFVSCAEDVIKARRIAPDCRLVSKIEDAEGLSNNKEIIKASDMVMVARGDLALSIGIENVPGAQRMLISNSKAANKPVIVATQMLLSMVNNPIPTRAEANDVFTSVEQGADAVMLSEESAKGAYPARAVQMLGKIAQKAIAFKLGHAVKIDQQA